MKGRDRMVAGQRPGKGWISRTTSLLHLCLEEIFDESAYTRFLQRTGRTSSPQAYAAFRHDCELAKARRPRCC